MTKHDVIFDVSCCVKKHDSN